MIQSLIDRFRNFRDGNSQFGMKELRDSFNDVDEALDGVESVLGSLRSWEAPLAAEIASHLATAGGKRLRPALLFLSYGAAGGDDLGEAEPYAAGCELIHTATLLHDDVIDQGLERRGVETANERFGNVNSVLSGDYLVAHVINELLELDLVEPVQELSRVMTHLVQGEILQDEYAHNLNITSQQYLQIARLKTSSLFSYAGWAGAFLPNRDEERADRLASFGEPLGVAFQMVDDVLDYQSDETGKTPLADLKQGKVNFPLILAMDSDPAIREQLEENRSSGEYSIEFLRDLRQRVRATDALRETRERAREYASRARACLQNDGDNRYGEALKTVSRYVFKRSQ